MIEENFIGDLLTIVHIKEHRRSRIVSITTSAIYQEKRNLAPALRQVVK